MAPALLAAGLVAAQGGWAALCETQTWDEGCAVAAGYRAVVEGDRRILPEGPPLLGLMVTGPLLALGARLPPLPDGKLPEYLCHQYAQQFLYRWENPHRAILLAARAMVLLLTLAAVVAVVVWAHSLHGGLAGWLAALLAGFEPNWIAHGHLAAWDGIATATMTLAMAAGAAYALAPNRLRAGLVGVLTGLALTAKHSALLLGPTLGLLFLLVALANRDARRAVLGHAVLAAVAAVGVVGAAYGLRYDEYLVSVRSIYRLNDPNYESYLLGHFAKGPASPFYPLVALSAKTPLGFLPLAPLGLWAAIRGGRAALWVPPLALVLLTVGAEACNPYHLGIRHVLPAIPALIILASGAVRLGHAGIRWPRLVAVAPIALAGLGAIETAARAPDYLSFFNVVAGGPENGIAILDDSNLDWGQDLERLGELQRREGLPRMGLWYFGSADPIALGLDVRAIRPEEYLHPEPGTYYAVSLHYANRLRRVLGPEADWLHRQRPWRRVGRSILVYRFDASGG